jgi:hypothetical protein
MKVSLTNTSAPATNKGKTLVKKNMPDEDIFNSEHINILGFHCMNWMNRSEYEQTECQVMLAGSQGPVVEMLATVTIMFWVMGWLAKTMGRHSRASPMILSCTMTFRTPF